MLKARASCFIKCEDEITFKGMSRAKEPIGNDKLFSSGESGAVGLGFVEEVLSNDNYKHIREKLGFDENSVQFRRLLLFLQVRKILFYLKS